MPRAKSLIRKIGPPSQHDFKHYLKENFIRNFPLTVVDVKRAVEIYGSEVYSLQGKTVKKRGKHAPKFVPIPMDPGIFNNYENDILCIDNFYVNGNVFFLSITRRMKFRAVAAVSSRKKKVLVHETKTVLNWYKIKQYNVTAIHNDQEFSCIREGIKLIELHICEKDDHVPEVERSIRTIKG